MRQKPKQERATETVKIISEATLQILEAGQHPKFTTNHIAERAGISIGSLYRYFPDKGAILRFIVKREVERMLKRVLKVVEASHAENGREVLDEVLDEGLLIFGRRGQALHNVRLLVEQDKQLFKEIKQKRLIATRCVYEKIQTLEPDAFGDLGDIELEVACEGFRTTVIAMGSKDVRKAYDREFLSKLAFNLLTALSNANSLNAEKQ